MLSNQANTHNRIMAFVWDYTGKPVPEVTFTHSDLS